MYLGCLVAFGPNLIQNKKYLLEVREHSIVCTKYLINLMILSIDQWWPRWSENGGSSQWICFSGYLFLHGSSPCCLSELHPTGKKEVQYCGICCSQIYQVRIVFKTKLRCFYNQHILAQSLSRFNLYSQANYHICPCDWICCHNCSMVRFWSLLELVPRTMRPLC